MSPIGEIWTHPDHPNRIITRQYSDGLTFNEDGSPIQWIEFDRDKTLTYNYRELADLGWERVTPELT